MSTASSSRSAPPPRPALFASRPPAASRWSCAALAPPRAALGVGLAAAVCALLLYSSLAGGSAAALR